jgi:hypothetical protein
MNKAGDGEAVLEFRILHRVPPHKNHAGLPHLVQTPFDDASQNGNVHVFCRKGHKIHSRLRSSPHGINIAQSIRRGDLAEGKGVIHDGGEEIYGLDEGEVIRHPVNPRVIGPVKADEKVGIRRQLQTAKRFVQVPWPQFGRSAGSLHRLCEAAGSCFRHFLISSAAWFTT